MSIHPTNRRGFLGSMAILSAGAVFGAVPGLFNPAVETSGLPQQWLRFRKENGGQRFSGTLPVTDNVPLPSSGHVFRQDDPVFFPAENMLAQATWIYWGAERQKPSDVFVTFYSNSQSPTKLLRLNRFELEALFSLPGAGKQPLAIVKEAAKQTVATGHSSLLAVKTKLRKNQQIRIYGTLAETAVDIEKKLIYHV